MRRWRGAARRRRGSIISSAEMQSRWHTNIPTVNEVVAHDAWPGIGVAYSRDRSAGSEAVECTFTVRAGGNSSAVRLAFEAPGDVELTADGDVETAIGIRRIRFTKPRVFEEGLGGRQEVAAKFVTLPSDGRTGGHQLQVRFEVARRDPSARLVIDPSLIYSTYLGGSGQASASTLIYGTGDGVNAIALDKDGNEYLTGGTTSQDFPATNEAFVSACTGITTAVAPLSSRSWTARPERLSIRRFSAAARRTLGCGR